MAKFPEPPEVAALAAIRPVTRRLVAGTLLFRVYFQGGGHPGRWDLFRAFGPTGARFDHHDEPPREQERAILYAASQGPTCLAEVFQDTRTIDRARAAPWIVAFQLARDVEVVDLTGAFATRVGASTAIHSGLRARARRWSRGFYAAWPTIEGILYCSSMNGNAESVALYERARGAMPGSPALHRAVGDPAIGALVERAARDFGYALV